MFVTAVKLAVKNGDWCSPIVQTWVKYVPQAGLGPCIPSITHVYPSSLLFRLYTIYSLMRHGLKMGCKAMLKCTVKRTKSALRCEQSILLSQVFKGNQLLAQHSEIWDLVPFFKLVLFVLVKLSSHYLWCFALCETLQHTTNTHSKQTQVNTGYRERKAQGKKHIYQCAYVFLLVDSNCITQQSQKPQKNSTSDYNSQ